MEARRPYLESKANKLILVRLAPAASSDSKLGNLATATERLPTELLQDIFLHCAEGVERPYGWVDLLAITHVCRRWRTVALGYERLWAKVNLSCHPGFLEATLQRSGECPIDLSLSHCNHQVSRIQAVMAYVLRRSSRIYSITARDTISTYTLLEHLPSSLEVPQLHVLLLHLDKIQGTSAVIPLLRSSFLTTCRFSAMPTELWTKLAMCRSLEVLHITKMFVSSRVYLNLVLVKDVLRNLTRLRELGLPLNSSPTFSLHAQSWSVEHTGTKVSLPHLRRLTVVGNAIFCSSLLRSLVFPPATFVYMEVECPRPLPFSERRYPGVGNPDYYAEALAAATSTLTSRDREHFVEFNLDAPGSPSVLQVEGWKVAETQEGYVVPAMTFLFPATPAYLSAVCRSFAPEDVETISLHDRLRGTPFGVLREIADIINFGLPNLHNLVLDECSSTFINLPMAGLRLSQIKALHVRTSDLRPCRRPSVHYKCANCLRLLRSALKTELLLAPQGAVLPSLRIYSKSKMTSADLKGFLEVADEVYYQCMDDWSISHSLKRVRGTGASEPGQQ